MVWSTKMKKIEIAAKTAHRSTNSKVVGSTPSKNSLNFTPSELFGAAARCSHLHLVNVSAPTPEGEAMARLIERYVDDVSDEFAIMADADSLKDYVKSYFAGTVGTGLAYLAMINEGYVWADHFENVGGGNSASKRKPDYVFAGPNTGLALMEAKGTRSATVSAFGKTVQDGYKDQVEPHLGHPVGGQTAVRGYAIGAWMYSKDQAELYMHHTRASTKPASSATAIPGASAAPPSSVIQRNSFATVFALTHSSALSLAVRGRDGDNPLKSDAIPFLRFRWLGHHWVSSALLPQPTWNLVASYPQTLRVIEALWPWKDPFVRPHMFAVRQDIATDALTSFLDTRLDDSSSSDMSFEVISPDLRERARVEEREGGGGAIFPDGMALIRSGARIDELELIEWRRNDGGFNSI